MKVQYADFLRAKVQMAESLGFEITAADVNPKLKPHQVQIVIWAVAGGRRAIFCAFGLGKTVIQLETVRITRARAGGMGLIVIPLGVRQEFMRDAAMLGIKVKFIRSIEECDDPEGIYLTNYETVREGKLDPRVFSVASLDEAACLRGFGGTKTFREFMALFAGDDRRSMHERLRSGGVRYRFVATATPSPNEFIELLAYCAFLGVMDVGQAKTRFFKRDSTKADKLTLHAHKTREFWLWMASWAIFVQRPSDLCGCPCHKEKTSSAIGSAISSFGSGYRENVAEPGAALATAAASTLPPQTTSPQVGSSVAAACDRSTAERAHAGTTSGAQCSAAAPSKTTKTGRTTAYEESASASAGSNIQTSSLTWDSLQPAGPSNAGTTTATTSPETASGPAEKPRLETRAAPSSSNTADEAKLSRHGPKNLASTTGNSTAATSSVGHLSECSLTYCDSCRCDEGYTLPPIDVRWHEVDADHENAGVESTNQIRMFRAEAIGVVEAAREKRESLPARLAKVMELRDEAPGAHRVLWHDQNVERDALAKAIPGLAVVTGGGTSAKDLDDRERLIAAFSDGEIQELAAKPVMLGSGCNLQRHCSWAIFVGIGFKFAELIQAIHRLQRFLQQNAVRIDLVYTTAERSIRRDIERKWKQHIEQMETMTQIIREFGLSSAAMASLLTRKLGVERVESRGDRFILANNDCVDETKRMDSNSVGLILTSIPFSTQYEYSPNYADFGHTDSNEHFFAQMDYLTPELLRVLHPGRLAAIHVKDRIVPGGMTGLGFQTVYPFHCKTIEHFTRHGFHYLGMKTIVTDVVRENNQTYRLGWSEQCKDASKMGVGMPEYLLIFRKAPSDLSNSYADKPVVKLKPFSLDAEGNMIPFDRNAPMVRGTGYSRSRWQIDAHGFTRSSGERLLTPEQLLQLPHDAIFKLFKKHSLEHVYDFEHHVALCEALEVAGKLPVTFMLMQPQSWSPEVWTDVTRMLTLNGAQSAKGKEMHLCPMQFDLADRAIAQWSMPDEEVYDPFGGLMTVPFRAVKAGRRGRAAELNPAYFLDGVSYCEAAEREASMPSLFDLAEFETEAEQVAA